VARARVAGLGWPLPGDLDDAALEARLYPGSQLHRHQAEPDFQHLYKELKRRGVTLQLLWHEYREDHPNDGYGYSRFCDLYRTWRKQLDVVMRQEHRAGEKTFVDWAGLKMPIIDPQTGEVTEVPIFVAALGASNYTYAEALPNQCQLSWNTAHMRAFEFFAGVSDILVPDNPRTAVTKPDLYDPDLNAAYRELAQHYDTTVIPARVRKPRDKAKVENAVLQVERWVLAPLRNQEFFSIGELNRAIRNQLDWLNNRPFDKLEGTRRSLYLELDKPALKPLPSQTYELAEWKLGVGVNIDHHFEFDHHYYSVSHTLINKKVDVRATATVVEAFFKGNRVALHRRSFAKGRYTTENSHRPKAHQRYLEWTPSRLVRWAATIGPATAHVVEHVLATKPHPEQGFRSCLGIIRLGKTYSNERLEKAAERAAALGTKNYKSLKSILKTGLDKQPLTPEPKQTELPLEHENIRGADYYH
jgi:transposase